MAFLLIIYLEEPINNKDLYGNEHKGLFYLYGIAQNRGGKAFAGNWGDSLQITAEPWMESAESGMESRRRSEWNQAIGKRGIQPNG